MSCIEQTILSTAARALPEIQRRYDAWPSAQAGAGLCFFVQMRLRAALAGLSGIDARFYSHDDHCSVEIETADHLYLLDIPWTAYETVEQTGSERRYSKRPGVVFGPAHLVLDQII